MNEVLATINDDYLRSRQVCVSGISPNVIKLRNFKLLIELGDRILSDSISFFIAPFIFGDAKKTDCHLPFKKVYLS